MSDTDRTPRPWSELQQVTTFEHWIDGFRYVLREPSALQLAARGVVPPALVLGQGGRPSASGGAGSNPVEKLVLDEAVQRALLEACVVEPAIGSDVPFEALGRHRDGLVIAILGRLYDTELARGAAFRDGQGDGDGGRTPGEAERALGA